MIDKPPSIEEIRASPLFATFAACMRRILGELAGWSSERVDEELERRLQSPDYRLWFGHDTPACNAAALILDERIARRLVGLDLVGVRARIVEAIELTGSDAYNAFPHEDPTYDWQAARQKVDDILRKYQHTSDSN